MCAYEEDWPDENICDEFVCCGVWLDHADLVSALHSEHESEPDMPSKRKSLSVQRPTFHRLTAMDYVVRYITNGKSPAKQELQGMVQCLINSQILPADFLVGAKRRRQDLVDRINSHGHVLIPQLKTRHVQAMLLRSWVEIRHNRGQPVC